MVLSSCSNGCHSEVRGLDQADEDTSLMMANSDDTLDTGHPDGVRVIQSSVTQGLRMLNPEDFQRPRNGRPTRHLYLANCGQGRGDTPETVLGIVCNVVTMNEVDALRIGDGGVSYISFHTVGGAVKVQDFLALNTAWVIKFADLKQDAVGSTVPSSVTSTSDVDVPGIDVLPNFVSDEEAQQLLFEVDSRAWDTTIKRRVQHYGHAFDYARLAIAENDSVAELPAFCAHVVHRIQDKGLLTHQVDQLTVNEYQPGVGIAFHVDAHSAFEDGIAALTLGSGIVMEFRKPRADNCGKLSVGKHHRLAPPPPEDGSKVIQKNVWLPPNSLLILRGEARYAWQHGIAWRKTDCVAEGQVIARGRRVSFTLRSARHQPCKCAWPMFCNSQNPEVHVLPSRLASPQHHNT